MSADVMDNTGVDLSGVIDSFNALFDILDTNYNKIDNRLYEQITIIDTIGTDLETINDNMQLVEERVDVMYQAIMWIILLLGLVSGILFVIVFSGGRKK